MITGRPGVRPAPSADDFQEVVSSGGAADGGTPANVYSEGVAGDCSPEKVSSEDLADGCIDNVSSEGSTDSCTDNVSSEDVGGDGSPQIVSLEDVADGTPSALLPADAGNGRFRTTAKGTPYFWE